MDGQFSEHGLQAAITPESVGFVDLHQTVHDGTGLGTTDRIHIDPVLTVDSEERMARSAVVLSMGTSLLSRKTRRDVS